jgi:uncharacterized tellurite resistance protein B-like protein
MNNELYLKTAFCCMACDGDIANEEIRLIRDYVKTTSLFEGLDVEKLLNEYVSSINDTGISFLNTFLNELQNEELTTDEKVKILKIAIRMIEEDDEVLYSEIKFFKRINACLNVSNEIIEKEFPDNEYYFLPDIAQQDFDFALDTTFTEIKLDLEITEGS